MGDLFMLGNPQAQQCELTPGMRDMQMWGSGVWDQEQSPSDFGGGSAHAMNATTAAYHADVAAKHAATLAQWVQYLSMTLGHLQNKVTELEDWKKKALEDVRKLREEHKVLRQKALGEDSDEQDVGVAAGASSLSSGLSLEATPRDDRPSPAEGGRWEPDALGIPKGFSSDTFSTASPVALSPTSPAFGDADLAHKAEGVHVTHITLDGRPFELAEWRIGHLSAKLRGCMGRALVSPPFSMLGLEDLRLMICPDGREVFQGPRSRRQKELYLKKITEGPLEACLKLKIPSCSLSRELEYHLKVGSQRRGPFKHNFAESTVSECDDFGVDWLKQLGADHSLTICIEMACDKDGTDSGK